MSSLRSREEARANLDRVYQRLKDKYIPADESQKVADGSSGTGNRWPTSLIEK